MGTSCSSDGVDIVMVRGVRVYRGATYYQYQVVICDDDVAEPPEDILIVIDPGDGYTPHPRDATLMFKITDNDGTVTLSKGTK